MPHPTPAKVRASQGGALFRQWVNRQEAELDRLQSQRNADSTGEADSSGNPGPMAMVPRRWERLDSFVHFGSETLQLSDQEHA